MLEGLDQFDRVVSGWFDEVEKASQQAAAGLAEVALQYIVDQSPQYTGDFVTGWEVGFTTAPNIWRPAKLLSRQMRWSRALPEGRRTGHRLGAEQGTTKILGCREAATRYWHFPVELGKARRRLLCLEDRAWRD